MAVHVFSRDWVRIIQGLPSFHFIRLTKLVLTILHYFRRMPSKSGRCWVGIKDGFRMSYTRKTGSRNTAVLASPFCE